jgi:hypothetical protein
VPTGYVLLGHGWRLAEQYRRLRERSKPSGATAARLVTHRGTGGLRRPSAIVAVALAAVGVTLALASAPAWGVQLGVGIAMVVGGLVLCSGPEA